MNFHFTWGEEGRIIGIVGANGSGKTTFSKVLCGLMAPRTGEIRLNGKK
ncbi:MAG: ATP-binding cassette domain-containing protein [Acutalibacteraceae bacterium]